MWRGKHDSVFVMFNNALHTCAVRLHVMDDAVLGESFVPDMYGWFIFHHNMHQCQNRL